MLGKEKTNTHPYKNTNKEDIKNEVWLDIVGYDGVYEVSNMGRIKSCERIVRCGSRGGTMTVKERIRKLVIQRQSKRPVGLIVKLSNDGVEKTHTVPVLVGNAFLGECEDGYVYSKRNKKWWDCRVDNLEIKTDNDTIKESYALGLHKRIKPCSEGKRTGPKSSFYIKRNTDGKLFLGRVGLRDEYSVKKANTIYLYSKTGKEIGGETFNRVMC